MSDITYNLRYAAGASLNHDCVFSDLMERAADEIKQNRRMLATARAVIEHWKSEQRRAFMAGFKARGETPDIEKAWQQYRCADDADWKAVSEPTKGADDLRQPSPLRHVETFTSSNTTDDPPRSIPSQKPDLSKGNAIHDRSGSVSDRD